MNRYLQRRRDRMMRDERNPYGSRGGYVTSKRSRDRAMDERGYDPESRSGHDYGYDMRGRSSRDYMGDEHYGQYHRPMEFYGYGVGGMMPHREDFARGRNRRDMTYPYYEDYGYENDYGYDYAEHDDKEYKKHLKEWEQKLKKHDKYGMSKEQVVQQARSYGAKFKEYDEEEFFVTYLMMISDYKHLSQDPTLFINMAKYFLEDEDSAVKGGEKLCAYMYEIALGEE